MMGFDPQTQLVARLHAEGHALKDIAKATGLSKGVVFNALSELGVTRRRVNRVKELTAWEEALLLGCLLGDGVLHQRHPGRGTPELVLAHSAKQRDYMQWKVDQLGDLFFPDAVRPFDNNGHPAVRATSRCSSLLVPYYELFYGNRTKKRYNEDVLQRVANHDFCDVILAVWFGDDGYRSSGNGKSLGFVLGERCVGFFERVAAWFSELGYDGVLHEHMGRHTYRYLLLRVASAHRFRDTVAAYLPACMQYKLDIGPTRTVRRSRGRQEV